MTHPNIRFLLVIAVLTHDIPYLFENDIPSSRAPREVAPSPSLVWGPGPLVRKILDWNRRRFQILRVEPYKAYVRGYTLKIWPYMVQYLNFPFYDCLRF
jgi:hypothetical protein